MHKMCNTVISSETQEIQTLTLLSYSHIIQRQSNNKTTEKQKNHSWRQKDKIKSLSKLCAISWMGWGLFFNTNGNVPLECNNDTRGDALQTD